ncbi:MAG TPA: choice-of-anchor tandem repeat GloVer-containing protein [Terriglobales bacterium]|jgi:uncharacterized repeat protein (TIGR03803 family)|nr:choice-of-anchor tandem repeat GloVer-containing protein [Terriglobales bacterium]
MTKLTTWKMVCIVFGLCAATAIASPAQIFTSLPVFNGPNGSTPEYMSLVQGFDGNFYGTTISGGGGSCSSGCGEVFRVTPKGTLTVLYSFCKQTDCFDGDGPSAGLVLGTDGYFYGTTNVGGARQGGTVFKISPGGAVTTLYDFCPPHCAGAPPAFPQAPLVRAINGSLYGATPSGGYVTCKPIGCGTLFEITSQGALAGVYRFCAKANCPDGYFPYAGLVQGADESFYGTTFVGGANNAGTVFKVTPNGSLTTLYSFCSLPNCADGSGPLSGLVQATDGNFYGTAFEGGNSNCGGIGCGTVFKITPTGALTTLYTFCSQLNCVDGSAPYAYLSQATDGNFYGTTSSGGTDRVDCPGQFAGCGTVFQITQGGTLTTLHSFSISDGANPRGGLMQATNGTLYGTTSYGGQPNCLGIPGNSCGTVFSLDMGLGPFVGLVSTAGKVGQTGGILGQGFTGTTSVSLNGIPASFTVVSDTFINATVPAGATTGYVTVATPSGTLTSNVPFRVLP